MPDAVAKMRALDAPEFKRHLKQLAIRICLTTAYFVVFSLGGCWLVLSCLQGHVLGAVFLVVWLFIFLRCLTSILPAITYLRSIPFFYANDWQSVANMYSVLLDWFRFMRCTSSLDYALALAGYGALNVRLRNDELVLSCCTQALAIAERVGRMRRFPAYQTTVAPSIALCLQHLARAEFARRNFAAADVHAQKAVDIRVAAGQRLSGPLRLYCSQRSQ